MGIILGIIVLIVFFDISAVQPVNWNPTYSLDNKNPYDLYVFNHEVDKIFPQGRLERAVTSPYDYFTSHPGAVNMIFIRKNMYDYADSLLLKQVAAGSNLWISAEDLIHYFTDTLRLKYSDVTPSLAMNGIPWARLSLETNGWKGKTFRLYPVNNTYAFVRMDRQTTTILGKIQLPDSVYYTSFVRIKYGKGFIYLHNQPQVFTNYSLLDGEGSADYVSHILSYLPRDRPFVWFVKGQTTFTGRPENDTALSVIFRYPALRAVWLLFLYGLLLFLLFNAKRRQRVVPIIPPLKNTTVEFVQTIGNLYFQEDGGTANMLEKKIIYFFDRVRSRYYLDTAVLDEKFAEKLQSKSGKEKALIDDILDEIRKFRQSKTAVPSDLIRLNELMEDFWGE